MKRKQAERPKALDAERILNKLEKSYFNGMFGQPVFPSEACAQGTDRRPACSERHPEP